MDIFKIGIIGIISIILSITIKNQSPQISLLISIVTGIIIFLIICHLNQVMLIVIL